MKILKYILFFLSSITLISCAALKRKGISEEKIELKSQIDPSVIIEVLNGSIYLEKNKVLDILNKELRKNLNKQMKSDKKALVGFLEDRQQVYKISEREVAYFSGMLSVVDKLLKKGEAQIFNSSNTKVNTIILKEMYGLYGSYTRSYTLMNGTELITTYAVFGE